MDIKAAYEDFKGDMDKIMESVLCVDYTDEPRIREIIQHAIDSGELPSYKAFTKESKQKMNSRKRKVGLQEAKDCLTKCVNLTINYSSECFTGGKHISYFM